ncbi:MAG: oxidoreductase [Verrucomicrobiae bacterium]|nr:oxidoreductase [Verrucomicrobiae bacterium]
MKLTEYDISHPYKATVVKSERITDPSTDEVRHITLNIADATFHYLEGQSIGVLVPGPHPFGNENHFRLYSIASTRSGEDRNMTQISLCVRRCFFIDDVSGESYPGIASNFLCDRQPGDKVQLTGPYGRHFLPPRDSTCNMIMIGVGTGIAPFRAFIKHIYEEWKEWKGKVRLFYGARTGMDMLYMNDHRNDISLYYDEATFKAFEAMSPRPHFNEPVNVDHIIRAQAEEVWQLILDPKTYVYVSGLADLEEILDMVFADLAGSDENWQFIKKDMVADGRWSTLFYD